MRLGRNALEPAAWRRFLSAASRKVLAVGREVIAQRHPAARSQRQIVADPHALVAIGRHEERFGHRHAARPRERHLADLRGRAQDIARSALGDSVSASALLSKPYPATSAGSIDAASISSASRSRIALRYSARFRRGSAGRPGLGCASAALSSSVSRYVTRSVGHGLVRPRPSGRRHRAGANLANDVLPGFGFFGTRAEISSVLSARPPDFTFSLWQLTQYFCTRRLMVATASALQRGSACARLRGRAAPACAYAGTRLRTLSTTATTKHVAAATAMRFHRTGSSGGNASSGITFGHRPGHGISFAPSLRSSTAVCGLAANEFPYSTPSATLQRRPAALVLHVELRALVEEILHDAVRAAIRGGVHRRFAGVGDEVHVGPSSSTSILTASSTCSSLGAILIRRPRDARHQHQRRDVERRVHLRIGAVREQQPHHLDIGLPWPRRGTASSRPDAGDTAHPTSAAPCRCCGR